MEEMGSCSTFTHHYTNTPVAENTQANQTVFIEIECDDSEKLKAPDNVKQESSTHNEGQSLLRRYLLSDPIDSQRATSPTASQPPSTEEREKLQCSECSKVYYSAEEMACHMRRHRGMNPFQCSLCQYNTYNKTLFREHVNGHLGVKPFQCGKCSYKSVSKKYIKIHEAKHVTCEKCGHVARSAAKLKLHKKDGCGVQGAVKKSQPNLRVKSKNKEIREYIDKLLESSSGDDSPASDLEATSPKEATEKGPYHCVPCNENFPSQTAITSHLKQHKPCLECDIQLPPPLLKKHVEKAHGITKIVEGKKFKCKVCEYRANGLAKILLHLIHHPQKVHPSIDTTPLLRCGFIIDTEE